MTFLSLQTTSVPLSFLSLSLDDLAQLFFFLQWEELFVLVIFETDSYFVAPAGLSILSAGITGLCRHA